MIHQKTSAKLASTSFLETNSFTKTYTEKMFKGGESTIPRPQVAGAWLRLLWDDPTKYFHVQVL